MPVKRSAELLTEAVCIQVEAVPPTINQLMRKHWSWRRNQKALWMSLLDAILTWDQKALLLQWAVLEGRRVRIEVTVHHSRQFDPDNLFSTGKIILDSLKSLEFILDDKSKHIEFHAAQVKAKKPFTVIRITPILEGA